MTHPIRTPESLGHYADLRNGGLVEPEPTPRWPWLTIAALLIVWGAMLVGVVAGVM